MQMTKPAYYTANDLEYKKTVSLWGLLQCHLMATTNEFLLVSWHDIKTPLPVSPMDIYSERFGGHLSYEGHLYGWERTR